MLTICYLVFQIADSRADTRRRAEEFVTGGDWQGSTLEKRRAVE